MALAKLCLNLFPEQADFTFRKRRDAVTNALGSLNRRRGQRSRRVVGEQKWPQEDSGAVGVQNHFRSLERAAFHEIYELRNGLVESGHGILREPEFRQRKQEGQGGFGALVLVDSIHVQRIAATAGVG